MAYPILVKKIDLKTGALVWFNIYSGTDNTQADIPASIVYDPFRNIVVHTGTRFDTDGQKGFFQVLDKDGLVLYDHIPTIDTSGKGSVASMTNGGEIWVGGYQSISPIGPAGFIYQYDIDGIKGFDFRYFMIQGSTQYTFQTGLGKFHTEAATKNMFKAIRKD